MKRVYLKILRAGGAVGGIETVAAPVYVYENPQNGQIQICHEVKAQGVLSADGGKIYQLRDKPAVGRSAATVEIITAAEYYELLATPGSEEDPELTDAQALQYIMEGSYEA